MFVFYSVGGVNKSVSLVKMCFPTGILVGGSFCPGCSLLNRAPSSIAPTVAEYSGP